MTRDPYEEAREGRRLSDLRLTPAQRVREIEPWVVREGDEQRPTRLGSVCRALNEAGARYLIAGANAGTLWGYARYTKDIDVLIEPTEENAQRVLDALTGLGFVLTHDLEAREVASRQVTTIGDLYHVDLLTRAGNVVYRDAVATARTFDLDGVPVPALSLDLLIESKQTDRLRDQADVEELVKLRDRLRHNP